LKKAAGCKIAMNASFAIPAIPRSNALASNNLTDFRAPAIVAGAALPPNAAADAARELATRVALRQYTDDVTINELRESISRKTLVDTYDQHGILGQILGALTQMQASATQMQASVTQMQASVTQMQASATQMQASVTQMQASVTQMQPSVALIPQMQASLDAIVLPIAHLSNNDKVCLLAASFLILFPCLYLCIILSLLVHSELGIWLIEIS
jgi:methyl-accepting chemotaxis protein